MELRGGECDQVVKSHTKKVVNTLIATLFYAQADLPAHSVGQIFEAFSFTNAPQDSMKTVKVMGLR